jgi:hypothetical protein
MRADRDAPDGQFRDLDHAEHPEKTTAGLTRPGSWTGRRRQREEALDAGVDDPREDRGRHLSKIDHSRRIDADAASVVILIGMQQAMPEAYSAIIICAQIVIIARDNASKVTTTAPTPMTCLAGPLISSVDPTAWSSRMVLSSETRRSAEPEKPPMVFGSRQWYSLAPPEGLETPGSR